MLKLEIISIDSILCSTLYIDCKGCTVIICLILKALGQLWSYRTMIKNIQTVKFPAYIFGHNMSSLTLCKVSWDGSTWYHGYLTLTSKTAKYHLLYYSLSLNLCLVWTGFLVVATTISNLLSFYSLWWFSHLTVVILKHDKGEQT